MSEQTASFSLPGYTELSWMARGGFSSVYRSNQIQYSRPVAVKVLDVGLDDERSRRQYQRECDATGRLTGHPNIVTVLDSGFTPAGKPYLVMDLCVNGTMGDRLAHEGPLPVADVLRCGVKIAGALETAHQAGILHRDLKPANILITAYGEPALSDFGIAAVTSHLEASVTMSAMTPNHAPPEVLEGARPTPASDIYSLASTLYALLAGRPPFAQDSGHSILAFITRVLTAEVPPIPRHDVPPALTEALVAALAKDPADRPSSAALFGYELQKVQVALGMPYTEMVTRSAVASGSDAVASAPSPAMQNASTSALATTPNESDGLDVPAAAATTSPPVSTPPPLAPDAILAHDAAPATAVGDATVLRPGTGSATTGARDATGAGGPTDLSTGTGNGDGVTSGSSSTAAIAPPTPDLADQVMTDGEMTMAVDRHAPTIERVEVEAPPEPRSRTPMVVAIAIGVLLLLGGGGYLAFGRDGDDTADPTAAGTPTTAGVPSSLPDPAGATGTQPVPSTSTGGPPASDVPPTSIGDPATGEAPAGVATRIRDAGGEIVIDVSWNNPGDARPPVVYQLLGPDRSTLSRISTLSGGTSSVIVTESDTGPLGADQSYCVAVGFISSSAKAVWAPPACTDGTTLDVTG